MDVALGPSGGEILAAECAAPGASGLCPRPALQADSVFAPPLAPLLHRLGLPASVHRDVRLRGLPGATICSVGQIRQHSSHTPSETGGFSLSSTPPFRPQDRYSTVEDGPGLSDRSGVALAVWNLLLLSN